MKQIQLVRITHHDDGTKCDAPVWCIGTSLWCIGTSLWDAPRTLCGGEAYGFGESGVIYKAKEYKPGVVTCEECKKLVKAIKEIKL